ncbi:conserved hypothetical protein [Ricinus communis]|uniref:Uncharacterized protein n=1 Tax=Ricinus communis TaxID=3988 RepID=B9RWG4_RICCO|nr:conserved hypothetical protein [Ricinus communis]
MDIKSPRNDDVSVPDCQEEDLRCNVLHQRVKDSMNKLKERDEKAFLQVLHSDEIRNREGSDVRGHIDEVSELFKN